MVEAKTETKDALNVSLPALLNSGRYWIRTSDPFRVKEVRYRCANRPIEPLFVKAVRIERA